ncbi:glycosyltransferase family 8 protein [Albidovulum sediminis]|uniref:Glycosyltransferase family 8 protein n=1 Tax=Albidovulum sediminis TaxID=3066345 RepID=A0ABT2NMX7_9RHOB|nr:glycosyltransferase [Defluviimonas sediminis]MCT8330075.1 hypothetical protein [Defluviimonas sediminis]
MESLESIWMHAIFFIADERLADLAGAAALQMTLHWDCDFHIFIERQEPTAQIREVGSGRITYHYEELGGFLPDGLPESSRWPRIVYLRLFAPRLLSSYRRLLYLDADILSFDADAALWEVPLPHGLGAVADLAALERGHDKKERKAWLAGIGVRSGRYANSGVLLIDPAVWNRIDFAGMLPEYFAAYPATTFPDQDFLAHVFDGRWTELSPRYNWQGGVLHWGLTRAVAPVFVHFCGMVRPWHGAQALWLDPNDSAYSEYYDRALENTGLSVQAYRKVFRLPPLRRAKYALLSWLSKKGIPSRREGARRAEWWSNHRFLRSYIEGGLAEARFAGEPRTRLDLREPHPFWDGRFVRVDGDLPPGDPVRMPPAEAT